MSSHQAPLFIKIKHANSTRKVRVPNQPAPVWSKLSAAILERFGIPEGQPIGLEYLDPEGDIITISSQVEFDELWHEITLAAKSTQKGGVDQRTLSLELVLIDFQSSQPTQSSDRTQERHIELGSTTPLAPTLNVDHSVAHSPSECKHADPAKIKGDKARNRSIPSTPASDPPEYPINTSPSPNSRPLLADPSVGLSALITAIDTIAPKLQDTLGGYAQMIVQVTDQLSDTCRVIANHLQEPSTRTAPIPRTNPLGERSFPSARSTSPLPPPPGPDRTFFGLTSHPRWNPSDPAGTSATALPCNPQEDDWYTRWAGRSDFSASDAHYHPVFRSKEFINPPFAPVSPRPLNKSPFGVADNHMGVTGNASGVAGFGNLQGKDRRNPPIFSPHDVPNPHGKGFSLNQPPHEVFDPYRSGGYTGLADHVHDFPDKTHYGVAGFDNLCGKDRSSSTSIPAKNSAIPKGKGKIGDKSWEKKCPSFAPVFRNINVSCPDKRNISDKSPFGVTGVGSNLTTSPRDSPDPQSKSCFASSGLASGVHPSSTRNSSNWTTKAHLGKGKSKHSGAAVGKSRDELGNGFNSILANESDFGGLGRQNAARQSPAPNLFSPPNHPKMAQYSEGSDGWYEPSFSNVNLTCLKSMAEQPIAASPRGNDTGAAEKKKGPVCWSDLTDHPPGYINQPHSPNFCKVKNVYHRKHPASVVDLDETSDNESEIKSGW